MFVSFIRSRPVRSRLRPNSTVEKCTVVIFDNEKIQRIKMSRKDTGFVDMILTLIFSYKTEGVVRSPRP